MAALSGVAMGKPGVSGKSNKTEYKTEAECKKASGKECSFVQCDYIPEGKTYEEVCGGVQKGWQPKTP